MWCVLAQISEMGRHKSRVIIFFYRMTRTKIMWLAQIRINKVHEVLAQITRNIFFSMKGQEEKLGLVKHKSQ